MRKGKIYTAEHARKGTIRFKFINVVKGDDADPKMWLVDLDTTDVPKTGDWAERILRPSLLTGDFD